MANIVTSPPFISFSKNPIYVEVGASSLLPNGERASFTVDFSNISANSQWEFHLLINGIDLGYKAKATPLYEDEVAQWDGNGTIDDYLNLLIDWLPSNLFFLQFFEAELLGSNKVKFTYKYYDNIIGTVGSPGIDTAVTFTANSFDPYPQNGNLTAFLAVKTDVQDFALAQERAFIIPSRTAIFDIKDAFHFLQPHLPDWNAILTANVPSLPIYKASKASSKFDLRYRENRSKIAPYVLQQSTNEMYCIYGGLHHSNDAAFLTENTYLAMLNPFFQEKEHSDKQPDFLYFFAKVNFAIAVEIEVQFKDGTNAYITPTMLQTNIEKGNIYYIPTGYNQLQLFTQNKEIVFYTVRIKHAISEETLAERNYLIDCDCRSWESIYLLYDTGLGGMETVRLKGKKSKKVNVSGEDVRVSEWISSDKEQGFIRAINEELIERIEVNTGFYEADYMAYLQQLPISKAWLIDIKTQKLIAVTVESKSLSDIVPDDETLFSLNLTLKLNYFDKAYN